MKRTRPIVLLAFIGVIAMSSRAVTAAPVELDPTKLQLSSSNVLVLGLDDDVPIYRKNAEKISPIASITKLMTAMVSLDANLSLDEPISIEIDDMDFTKGSHSRLRLGVELSRKEMLRLALMSSENRAASSLARSYPGGADAFVAAMNRKAKAIGMQHSHFVDPTGLSSYNVSTAHDLAKMVKVAAQYELIREFTTTAIHQIEVSATGQILNFNNTNALVRNDEWKIELSKTGFIREAGRCLVMMATITRRPVVIVLLDSLGKVSRLGDANRIRHWLETGEALPLPPKPVFKPKKVKTIKLAKTGRLTHKRGA